MILMVFEYRVHDSYYEQYLQEAAALRPHLEEVAGFISIERFESTATPGRFVSIGYFENEDAVTAWRNTPAHRRVQSLGRKQLLSEYRLCMAEVDRDYSKADRGQAPKDSHTFHDEGKK